ncbi:MAG: DUF433 domain-containing protein [Blastocatellia bacterium]|jgi:uncharacterized protein (DUF433 family)|nr:DUF433 domain-containing protein [Blastocatellia bacterium]
MSNEVERVIIDPEILNGKPSIRGTRVSVQTVVEYLSNGDSIEEVLENYPSLTRDDVLASLKFAANMMDHKFIVEPLAV